MNEECMLEKIVIVAVAENGVIGNAGDIPWRIKEDWAHFKEITMGYPCIMGCGTYESLPPRFRPLPGRENLVLSTRESYTPDGAKKFSSLDNAIAYCEEISCEKVFFIGGARVYIEGTKRADTIELTRIHRTYEGDTFYPDIDPDVWKLVRREDHESMDVKNQTPVSFSFLRYHRTHLQ